MSLPRQSLALLGIVPWVCAAAVTLASLRGGLTRPEPSIVEDPVPPAPAAKPSAPENMYDPWELVSV